jgi:hypothetical protein
MRFAHPEIVDGILGILCHINRASHLLAHLQVLSGFSFRNYMLQEK